MKRIGDNFCTLLVVLAFVGAPAFGATKKKNREPAAAANQDTSAGFIPSRRHSASSDMGTVQMIPTISLFNPSDYILSNDGHRIAFSDQPFGLPTFSVALSHPLWIVKSLEIDALARVGYGYKSMRPMVNYASGINQSEDVTLHTFPLTLAIRGLYEFRSFTLIRPGLIVGATTEPILQRGNNSALNQFYFVPSIIYGLSLSFLDSGRSSDDWFGGFTFDTMLHNSFGPQKITGLSFNFGFNILL